MHIGSFHLCAFFVSCVFRRESVVFPGRVLISFLVFRIFLGLQHLCVTTDSRLFDNNNNYNCNYNYNNNRLRTYLTDETTLHRVLGAGGLTYLHCGFHVAK